MKKFIPIAFATVLAFALTFFSAFRSPEKNKTQYYFKFDNVWYDYTGQDACDPGISTPCQVSNPLPDESGDVQLYLSENDAPGNRLFRD